MKTVSIKIIALSLLLCQAMSVWPQPGFDKTGEWLEENVSKMGGRAILMVYKDGKNIGSMEEAIEKIAELPMEGDLGTVFHYSNAGLQIAGAVIEKITGKSFEELFVERIARPLNMTNTDFGKGKVALPAGGASSTPQDYMNFLVMILDKGMFKGKRILSENSIAEMQVNRVTKDVTIGSSPAEAGNFGNG